MKHNTKNKIKFELTLKTGVKIIYEEEFLNYAGATELQIEKMLRKYPDTKSYKRIK